MADINWMTQATTRAINYDRDLLGLGPSLNETTKIADNADAALKEINKPSSKLPLIAAVTTGGLDLFGNLLDRYANRDAARMQASAYRSNARLALMQYRQQNRYLNEEMAQNVWNAYDSEREFLGKQLTSMGASGFADVSRGDQNLLADTRIKTDQYTSGLNETAYKQSFENFRQASMEASRLEYAAQMAEARGKIRFSGILGDVFGATASALGAFASFGASDAMEMGNNINPTGQVF